MSTASRYQHLRSELDEECNKAGRNPQEVLLLAVSKTVDLDQVALAIEAGASTLIHSVCKEAHLSKIDSAAEKIGKCQRLLLEVNVSGEESKSGFSPDEVEGILERAAGLSHISIEGLMTMAPQGKEEAIVATFSGLERLRDNLQVRLQNKGISCHLSALSMGMTEDWRSAVGFGTTIVRVGRAIFSDEFE